MKMIKMLKCSNGQTIIEALIALGIAVIIVSAIAVAVITAINNSDYSKNENLATQYAQQGMDYLRQLSESDWTLFSTSQSTTYCLGSDNKTLSASPCLSTNLDNYFIRSVIIGANNSCNSVATSVKVIVAWSDGKCTSSSNIYCHSAELDSCFANLQNITP